jgi:hypothetical protein
MYNSMIGVVTLKCVPYLLRATMRLNREMISRCILKEILLAIKKIMVLFVVSFLHILLKKAWNCGIP